MSVSHEPARSTRGFEAVLEVVELFVTGIQQHYVGPLQPTSYERNGLPAGYRRKHHPRIGCQPDESDGKGSEGVLCSPRSLADFSNIVGFDIVLIVRVQEKIDLRNNHCPHRLEIVFHIQVVEGLVRAIVCLHGILNLRKMASYVEYPR